MKTTFRILHWLCCLVLGGIFIYSGYIKYHEGALQFAVAIEGYKLAPQALVWPLANYLPIFEMALGVFLLSGWKTRYSATITTALLLFFIVVLTITYARGIDADCGCFSLTDKISPKTIVRDSIILLPALFLLFESRIRSRFIRPVETPASS
jgi:putative oxidoreductase